MFFFFQFWIHPPGGCGWMILSARCMKLTATIRFSCIVADFHTKISFQGGFHPRWNFLSIRRHIILSAWRPPSAKKKNIDKHYLIIYISHCIDPNSPNILIYVELSFTKIKHTQKNSVQCYTTTVSNIAETAQSIPFSNHIT